jgi:hypothetical protein
VFVLGTAIAAEAIFLVPLVRQQEEETRQGQVARARQIRVAPVACKEHTDAWRRDVITLKDLTVVWGCPAP